MVFTTLVRMRSHETLYLYLLAQFLNWTVPPKCMKSVHKNSKFKWVGLCSFHFRLYVKFINWYTIDLFDLCQTRPDQRGCGFNHPFRNIIFIYVQIHYSKLFMYASMTYNYKQESKVFNYPVSIAEFYGCCRLLQVCIQV